VEDVVPFTKDIDCEKMPVLIVMCMVYVRFEGPLGAPDWRFQM